MKIFYKEAREISKGRKITAVVETYYVVSMTKNGKMMSSTKSKERATDWPDGTFEVLKNYYEGLDNRTDDGKIIRELSFGCEQ